MRQVRLRRYIRQILPFGVIWLLFGVVYLLLEYGLIGTLDTYPTTGNKYNFKNSAISTCLGALSIGLIQGMTEIFWLKTFFKKRPFWQKVIFKSIFYLFFVVFFLALLTLVSNAFLYKTTLWDPIVLDSLLQFMNTFAFWSVVIFIGIIMDIALFYSEIEEYLGDGIIATYLGRYHKPKQETLIFMFLDMKSSTSIAEELGHKTYFQLLRSYYSDMTHAILATSGKVYQYVGDEIVVSWKKKNGSYNNNCLECFRKISEIFKENEKKYLRTFGVSPSFKAGMHIGQVTTGEIGLLKKDIFHTGDALNTAARIQAECNTYNSKTLISGELREILSDELDVTFTHVETLLLRGKTAPVQLYDVAFR